MTARQTSSRSLKSILGAGIFVFGLFLLSINLDGIGAKASSMVGTWAETPGLLSALALAGLHAVQAYTFDHAGFLSSLLRILVSFWPLLLIVVGATLLRHAFKGHSGMHVAEAGSLAAGERQ